jgi:hypothetical protein
MVEVASPAQPIGSCLRKSGRDDHYRTFVRSN